jgi:hypothetical protein
MAQGRMARDDGMQLALFNESEPWIERAWRELLAFAERNQTFYLEDFRLEWAAKGNERPHHPNVWGALSSRLKKEGYAWTGIHRPSVDPRSHARAMPQWAKRGVQQ